MMETMMLLDGLTPEMLSRAEEWLKYHGKNYHVDYTDDLPVIFVPCAHSDVIGWGFELQRVVYYAS